MLCKACKGKLYPIQAHAWLHLTGHYFDEAHYGTLPYKSFWIQSELRRKKGLPNQSWTSIQGRPGYQY